MSGQQIIPKASQAQAEAGTNNTAYMTSLTTAQALVGPLAAKAAAVHTHDDRYFTEAEIAAAYQPILVSGTNIKTVNNTSLIGSGNITITVDTSTLVVGPASATDNAIARFDLTTGKLIQNSSATCDDSGNINCVGIRLDGMSTLSDNAYFKCAPATGFRINSSSDAYNNFISYENGDGYLRSNLSLGAIPGATPTIKLNVEGDARITGNVTSGNLSLINSTTPMQILVYNTYTSPSVYERGFIKFSGNALKIGCEHSGASQREVHISNIPTSNPGAGILWNDGGTLKIGT